MVHLHFTFQKNPTPPAYFCVFYSSKVKKQKKTGQIIKIIIQIGHKTTNKHTHSLRNTVHGSVVI